MRSPDVPEVGAIPRIPLRLIEVPNSISGAEYIAKQKVGKRYLGFICDRSSYSK